MIFKTIFNYFLKVNSMLKFNVFKILFFLKELYARNVFQLIAHFP